jgi:hypothetical protein
MYVPHRSLLHDHHECPDLLEDVCTDRIALPGLSPFQEPDQSPGYALDIRWRRQDSDNIGRERLLGWA